MAKLTSKGQGRSLVENGGVVLPGDLVPSFFKGAKAHDLMMFKIDHSKAKAKLLQH